jgi:hypothetical protein
MPFATDKRQRMFNARNLNSLYERFDQKCARVLDGKNPKVAGLFSTIPRGVVYQYTRDAASSFYVFTNDHNQSLVEDDLSNLDIKHLDKSGGEVFVDRYVTSFVSTYCNVSRIQRSFELHTREVGGINYDVHLGWDDWNSGLSSYVRSYFADQDSSPSLPPARIHNHKTAVAEILVEGLSEFRILNTYKRYDCWRVSNCGSKTLTVYLQRPDGSSQRESIAPMGCRAFRRRADGFWLATWPSGVPCNYFFPYVSGDVPYFAGGPPMYGGDDSLAVCQERSAKANNVANPFLLLQWFRSLGGWHDPFIPLDIRGTYPDVYSDPENSNTPIGDLIFTWGRARVQIYSSTTGVVSADYTEYFRDTASFVPTLRNIGIEVDQIGGALGLRTLAANTIVRIYPIDCNVFFTSNTLPYWEISPSLAYFSTIYPAQFWVQNLGGPLAPTSWSAGNDPDWFDTMRTLRRRIAVEEGFLNSYDDEVDISEEKVSRVSLTPLGLMVRAATAVGIEAFDANAESDLPSYEAVANKFELWTDLRPSKFGALTGGYYNTRYVSGTKIYYLQNPANSSSGWYRNVFPNLSTPSGTSYPAVDCAYIPAGGPWAFSSSVYDANLSRVFTSDPNDPVTENVHGADFWINKWGGAGGVDASVRVLGRPDQTQQLPIQTTTAVPSLVRDDVFKDQNQAAMAGMGPWSGAAAVTNFQQAWIADIRFLDGDQYFKLPFVEQATVTQYDLNGQFYHKIPKSAYLWNLLEWTVRAWTRAIPLCLGQTICPIFGFNATGNPVVSNLWQEFPLSTMDTGTEGGEGVFYLDEYQYNVCLANGIVAHYGTYPAGGTYWYVSQTALATYSASKGFKSYNFDTTNAQPNLVTPVAATAWIPLRSYGVGETVQMASYFDDILNQQFYRAVRYVSLRLPNELSA